MKNKVMVRLKKVKRIKDSLFNCDLYRDGEEVGFNVNLDYKDRGKTLNNLSWDIRSYAHFAMEMLEQLDNEKKEIKEELWTMWY